MSGPLTHRVMGVDPGTLRMGYGLLEARGQEARYLASGALTVRPRLPMGERLRQLHQGLLELLHTWTPAVVAIEDPFVPVEGLGGQGYRSSVRSAIAVGQAQAVALMAAAAMGLPVFRYPPARVKSVVAGYGRGGKEQVAETVRLLLGLEKPPTPSDAADALAVALCHIQEDRVRALSRGCTAP